MAEQVINARPRRYLNLKATSNLVTAEERRLGDEDEEFATGLVNPVYAECLYNPNPNAYTEKLLD